MAYDFFSFWVGSLWGSNLMALFGTAFLLSIIGILGKFSYMLLFVMLSLYFIVFGVGFFGMAVWLPLFILGIIYFFIQLQRYFAT